MRKITYPPTSYDMIPCQGGWDVDTPTLSLPNGYVRDALNFEVSHVKGGGYKRIEGYERFDGRAAPSSATFSLLQLESNVLASGQVPPEQIVGVPSGATAQLLWVASNYLVVTAVSGNFVVGDALIDLAANPIGTLVAQTVAPSSLEVAQYTNAAADYYRSLIAAVPGSGAVRGVAVLPISGTDTVFAWRDNVGGTAVAIYKATGSGWTSVSLLNEVLFTAGSGTLTEGETLTQGGVTSTVRRVVHETGSWAGGTAAGRLIVNNPTGGNFAAGAATGPASAMTLSGAQTAITIAPGGKYKIIPHNFAGQSSTKRLYGISGVGKPFEFDGTVYVPLNIGTNNAPTDIVVHREHLMFAVASSVIGSGPGVPYQVNAAAGGFEFALGDVITNFLPQPGDTQAATLVITTESNVHTLYGTSSLNWNLVGQNTGVMGIAYTGARLNQSYWLDDNGVTNLRASQEFGNFNAATITNNIMSYVKSKNSSVLGAVVNRDKSQYRLYFTDTTALYCTIVNNRLFGLMPQQFTHTFSCVWDGISEETRIFMGGSTGYVYQMDVGTSFDGDDIDAHLVFNWNATRSPRILKRYRKASIEVQGGIYASIQFGFNLSYSKSGVPQDTGRSYQLASSGTPFWDSFTWDNFYWDGSAVSPTEVEMRGSGENMQLVLRSGTDYTPTYTINSILLHYTPRRGLR